MFRRIGWSPAFELGTQALALEKEPMQ